MRPSGAALSPHGRRTVTVVPLPTMLAISSVPPSASAKR
jgi:hypothetical protein